MDDDPSKKRALSSTSPSSASESPATKRRAVFSFDGEEQVFHMPDDAPPWVPLMFQSLDKMTSHMVELWGKVEEIGSKFDNFKTDVNNQINEFKSEVNAQVEELDKSVKFVSKNFDDQQKEINGLKEELKAAIDAHAEILTQKLSASAWRS